MKKNIGSGYIGYIVKIILQDGGWGSVTLPERNHKISL